MANSIKEGKDMPSSKGESPKKLRDSGKPKETGPVKVSGAGGMSGSLSAAKSHLGHHASGKFHKTRSGC